MYIIRRAKIEDADTLLKLAKMVHFINLPPDKEIITEKILRSRDCFKHVGRGLPPQQKDSRRRSHGLRETMNESELFAFVVEDVETGAVLGSSQLVASMGGPGNPNVGFKISERKFFSQSLHTGVTHMVATLHLDESGPTEIGGLILQPAYRAHKAKLGRFLSFVRFHFIGLHRAHFADHVLAEMMAPLTSDGDNRFWDALGRRFINLSYDEADRFCQYSREFMFSLLPREDIYLTLLAPQARQGVGQVGQDTIPARKMLEKLGFEYRGVVDPFDGGPHLQAATDDIPLVRATRTVELGKPVAASSYKGLAILSVLDGEGEFVAVQTPLAERGGTVRIPRQMMEALGVGIGDRVACTLIDPMPKLAEPGDNGAATSPERRRSTKKPAAKKATATKNNTKTRSRKTSKKPSRRKTTG
ncbi:MAG: arginine N-succinyltransferase [Planctomycetota bacterium]